MFKILSLTRILGSVDVRNIDDIAYVIGGKVDFEAVQNWAMAHVLKAEGIQGIPARVESSLAALSEFSYFIVNTKPRTDGCISGAGKIGAVEYRVDLQTLAKGVAHKHEVKGLVFKASKGGAIHVFLMPASRELDMKSSVIKKKLNATDMEFMRSIGVVQFTVNPFSMLDAFKRNPDKFPNGLVFHIDEKAFNEVDFVTNNVGSTVLSCSVPRNEYFDLFLHKIKSSSSSGSITVLSTEQGLFRPKTNLPSDSEHSEAVSPTDSSKPKGPVHSASDSSLLVHGNRVPVGGTGSSDNSEQAPQTV